MAHSPLLLLVATSLVLVFGAKASSSSQDNAVPTNTKAGDLLTGLLRHYSKADHPGVNGPVTISHGLNIMKLKELDVEEQSLSLVGYETWSWEDPRLAWTPEDANDLGSLRVELNHIWTPDIFLFNSDRKPEDMFNAKAVLSSAGSIIVVVPKVLSAVCNTTQLTCKQTCALKFGSWAHSADDINLVPMAKSVSIDYFVPNPKWTLVASSATRNSKKYPCCPEEYVDVTYSLSFKCARRGRQGMRFKNRQVRD